MNALTTSLWRGCWQGLLLAVLVAAVCAVFRGLRPATRQALWWCVCLKFVASVLWFEPPTVKLPASQAQIEAFPILGGAASTGTGVTSTVAGTALPSAATVLTWIWALGAALMTLRVLSDSLNLARLTKPATGADSDILSEARLIALRMGLRRMPPVRQSPQITSPMVVGFFRPTLLLPARFGELSASERAMALAHEFAHIRRHDLMLGVVPALATVLFWFFPAALWASNCWIVERESACDEEAVFATGAQPKEFGEMLLKITATDHVALPKSAIGATADFGSIKQRLERLGTMGRKGFRYAPSVAVFGLLLPIVPWAFSCGAPDSGLIKNASFESGTSEPDSWTHSGDIPGVDYVWDKQTGHTGTHSIGFSKTAQRYFPIAQWSQEITYDGQSPVIEFSGWIKAQDMQKSVLDVQFEDANHARTHKWVAYIGAKNNGDPPASHDWQKYTGAAPIPAGTKKIWVAIQDYGPGKIWLDDVSAKYLKEMPPEEKG